ncbi:MAG: hypothetical protein U1C57_01750 [Candidatus Doudnabacteria bacterium]|nr:hypothetical protein [Candidatus Doudnabacteria bacterium]
MTDNFEQIEIWSHLVNRILDYCSKKVIADAIFVHGWGDLHDEMIELTARVYKESGAKFILLNGAKEYEIGAPGFEYWKESLVKKHRIPPESVTGIESASNTLIEAQRLKHFIEEKRISSISIISVPQHIIRAFLTDLGVISQGNSNISLYPKSLKEVDWAEPIVIRNLSGANENTTRLGRLAAEFARILDYRKRMKDGDNNFIIASAKEGLEHLEKER